MKKTPPNNYKESTIVLYQSVMHIYRFFKSSGWGFISGAKHRRQSQQLSLQQLRPQQLNLQPQQKEQQHSLQQHLPQLNPQQQLNERRRLLRLLRMREAATNQHRIPRTATTRRHLIGQKNLCGNGKLPPQLILKVTKRLQ